MSDIAQECPPVAQNGHSVASEPFDPAQYTGKLTADGRIPPFADPAFARQAKAIAVAREQLRQEALLSGLPPDPYLRERVIETREAIARIHQRLLDADDPQEIMQLAAAISKLQETERELAGRPLPGTYRPQADNKSDKPSVTAAIRAARESE